MSMLRWGILGTGNIARQFCAGVATATRSKLLAVGSREPKKAAEFAATHQIPMPLKSYAAVCEHPDVDAVYISLPNSMHHEWTLRALSAGKHVLCEKPIAANAAQAQEMFDAANRAGRVLMEAFMYRSHPMMLAAMDAVKAGAIGQVKIIRSSFCFKVTKTENNIRFRPDLAGGVLMDVGCYSINFSRAIAGADPIEFRAMGRLHSSGVDEYAVGMMKFPGGVLASFTCGMSLHADNSAYILGSEGYIEIPIPWKPARHGAAYTIGRSIPPKMEMPAGGVAQPKPKETFTFDAPSELFGLEADDFAAAVLDGAPVRVPPAETLANMRVLDEMRKQVGTKS